MWYVLTEEPTGYRYWDGPHAEAAIRDAAVAGHLPGNVLLRSSAGRQITVGALLAPQESPPVAIGKLALWAGGIYLGVKAVGEIAQHLSDTPEQRSIRNSAREHEENGAEVCADHIGWECAPPLLGRRRPDVYADYGDFVVVEEHETEASVNRRHSIEQDRDLRRWASRRPYVDYEQVIG